MEFSGEVGELTTEQVVILMDQQNQKPVAETELKTMNSTSTGAQTPPPRISFSKPKSRFLETKHQLGRAESIKVHDPSSDDDSDENTVSGEEGGEDGDTQANYRKKKLKISKARMIEWVSFLVIMTALICSLTVKSLKDKDKWNLKIWQWCLMLMAIICGRLVSGWLVRIMVFFIEKNFMLREKVLYFVYGLQRSFQNVVWLGLVMVSWSIMFSPDEIKRTHPILLKVFKALISVLIGAIIWLVKILLVKLLASSFHVATFFDRMKESVFHHYILEMLSGPPLDETDPKLENNRKLTHAKTMPPKLNLMRKMSLKRTGSRKIDMERLRKLSRVRTANAWSVKRLVNYVKSSGLSTISRTVDDFGKAESEINSEWEARACAQRTFINVAKPGAK